MWLKGCIRAIALHLFILANVHSPIELLMFIHTQIAYNIHDDSIIHSLFVRVNYKQRKRREFNKVTSFPNALQPYAEFSYIHYKS